MQAGSNLKFSISSLLKEDFAPRPPGAAPSTPGGAPSTPGTTGEKTPGNPQAPNPALVSPWFMPINHRIDRHFAVRRLGHPYQARAPPKHKKPRTCFTKGQVAELEKRFTEQKYLASTERASLAKSLQMSDSQVKTWFQNRRTKWRRQTVEEREQERQAAFKFFGGPDNAVFPGYLTSSAMYIRPDVKI